MHRDLKLGLALAVLLIGSTTAFFFRNDADPDAGLPQLKNAAELDRAVAERDDAPYIAARSSISSSDAGDAPASPWAKPAFLRGPLTAAVTSDTITPDPIQIVMEEEFESGSSKKTSPAPPLAMPEVAADGTPFHVVQSGDTLSGIASRYLGSIARFDEIYELNRDQLTGPHALKIGMKLRLPTTHEPPQAADATASSSPADSVLAKEASFVTREATTDTSESDAPLTPVPPVEAAPGIAKPSAEGLFKPAKRTPFVPSRYRAPKLAQ